MLKLGKINPYWKEDYKDFAYESQPIKDEEIALWEAQGYEHKQFAGDMYGGPSPIPTWTKNISSLLGMLNCGYTFYRMGTMTIMPTHVDHFDTYIKVFGVERTRVVRTIVFLEDWKPGHYFEVSGRGIVNWQAGEWVMWDADVDHAASNIGVSPRYTLQLTGTLCPKKPTIQ